MVAWAALPGVNGIPGAIPAFALTALAVWIGFLLSKSQKLRIGWLNQHLLRLKGRP
jgi:hypothetical protein